MDPGTSRSWPATRPSLSKRAKMGTLNYIQRPAAAGESPGAAVGGTAEGDSAEGHTGEKLYRQRYNFPHSSRR
jgi:hypothetical protein